MRLYHHIPVNNTQNEINTEIATLLETYPTFQKIILTE